jgi:hypothetical protein
MPTLCFFGYWTQPAAAGFRHILGYMIKSESRRACFLLLCEVACVLFGFAEGRLDAQVTMPQTEELAAKK